MSDLIERRGREKEGGERYVPIAIDFELDGETLLSLGGRWDRRANDYDGEASVAVVVRIHAGQLPAVEWFGRWLDAHVERRQNQTPMTAEERAAFEDRLENGDISSVDTDDAHAFAALFAGGRRAGKTWIAVAMAVAYAVRFPGSLVWLTSPADTKHGELIRYVRATLAREWIDRDTDEGWELCNGSQLLLKSAYNPDGLKEGQAHFVLLNEGQQMQRRAYTVARGATVDQTGIVIVCANPPVEAKDQQWVVDLAVEAQGGRTEAIYLHFDSKLNPHINLRALYALAASVDKRTADIEVWGHFGAAIDAVAYNWVRLENELEVPANLAEVTEQFLSSIEEGAGILQVVGLDVQRIPYIGGPVYRFFGIPHRDLVLAWIVDEVVLPGGDEEDFCTALEAKGYLPDDTLIVCDATAEYQHSRRRETDSPPPEWQGRGSWSIIKQAGYRRIVAPDRKMRRKNPAIQDRIRAFTSLICSDGTRRLFADPTKAPESCKAIREWKIVHGAASRTQYEAHLGDGISYVIHRLFPRRAISNLTKDERSRNQRAVMRPGTSIRPTSATAPRGMIEVSQPRIGGGPLRPSQRGSRGRGL